MEDTKILTFDEFISLDPTLTQLLTNELVVRLDAHPDHEPAWKYRITPAGELEPLSYVDASSAAYARYMDMTGGPQVHRTVEAFAEATGLSIEMIKAHVITQYNSASGVPLHVLDPWDDHPDDEATMIGDHNKVEIAALRRVAVVCREYRGSLEQVAHIADHEDVFGVRERIDVQQAVRAILEALDDWHAASIAVIQTGTERPFIREDEPAGFDYDQEGA